MPSLLLVEDSPSQALLHQTYLQSMDLEVVLAETGAEAKKALDAQKFDLMLLDLGLPDMHGLALLNDDSLKLPGVIVLTGEGSVRSAVDVVSAGLRV